MSLFDDSLLADDLQQRLDHGEHLRRRINQAFRDLGVSNGRDRPDLASSSSDFCVSLASLGHDEADRLARSLEDLVRRAER